MNDKKLVKATKLDQNKPKQTFCRLSKTQENPSSSPETKKQSEFGPAENRGGYSL
jgi:hypothetical protein